MTDKNAHCVAVNTQPYRILFSCRKHLSADAHFFDKFRHKLSRRFTLGSLLGVIHGRFFHGFGRGLFLAVLPLRTAAIAAAVTVCTIVSFVFFVPFGFGGELVLRPVHCFGNIVLCIFIIRFRCGGSRSDRHIRFRNFGFDNLFACFFHALCNCRHGFSVFSAAVVAILAVVTSAAVIAVSAPFGAFAAFAGKFRREIGNNDFPGGFFRQLNDCRFCTDAEKTFCSVLNNIYCDLVD